MNILIPATQRPIPPMLIQAHGPPIPLRRISTIPIFVAPPTPIVPLAAHDRPVSAFLLAPLEVQVLPILPVTTLVDEECHVCGIEGAVKWVGGSSRLECCGVSDYGEDRGVGVYCAVVGFNYSPLLWHWGCEGGCADRDCGDGDELHFEDWMWCMCLNLRRSDVIWVVFYRRLCPGWKWSWLYSLGVTIQSVLDA